MQWGHVVRQSNLEVIERTITTTGQILLIPAIDIATYWTSLPNGPATILP